MNILKTLFGDKPKDVAKDRLNLILIQDRGGIPMEFLEKIRTEIIEVISKYIPIVNADIDISLNNDKNVSKSPILMASIPIKERF